MSVESLWTGLAMATTFLSLPHSSRFWLEFVTSDFRRAKAFDAKPMMFKSFCLKIRLTLTLVWIFEANWLGGCEKGTLSLCYYFQLCLRCWGNDYTCSVEK